MVVYENITPVTAMYTAYGILLFRM